MSCSIFEIGKRITELRKERNMSQDDLASDLHVSREVVAKWENGTRDLKTQYTSDIAEFFGVSADFLLGKTDIRKPDVNLQSITLKTGLSEKAIEYLERLVESKSQSDLLCLKAINTILEQEEHSQLIQKIALYLFAKISIPVNQNAMFDASADPLKLFTETTDLLTFTATNFKMSESFRASELRDMFIIQIEQILMKLYIILNEPESIAYSVKH